MGANLINILEFRTNLLVAGFAYDWENNTEILVVTNRSRGAAWDDTQLMSRLFQDRKSDRLS
jgi:hypothetical protein